MKSTNMLERLNEEIKRRTHIARIFPNEASCLRLARALCVETHENWIEAHRYLDMSLLREHKKQELMKLAGVAPIKSDKNLRIFLRPPKEISSDRALLPMPHCCKNARLNPSGALRAAFAFFRLCGILGLRGSGGNFFEKRFLFSSILPR